MSLLISTVAAGSRKRLAPLRGAAVNDARDVAAMLGAHQQHEAAVALGHHIVLQVLRRVLAAGELLERVAEPLPQLAQPVADAAQRRAGVVEHLAGDVDGLPDGGDLAS